MEHCVHYRVAGCRATCGDWQLGSGSSSTYSASIRINYFLMLQSYFLGDLVNFVMSICAF